MRTLIFLVLFPFTSFGQVKPVVFHPVTNAIRTVFDEIVKATGQTPSEPIPILSRYSVGCTDPRAGNYDSNAVFDDNSCTYTSLDCALCDHVIEPGDFNVNNDTEGIAPGSLIGIRGGSRTEILIQNFNGTASEPFTFVNCNGLSEITQDAGSAIDVRNSSFLRISGTGCAADTIYGISILEATQSGVRGQLKVSDIEIDHIEIDNVTNGVGIWIVNRPTCDLTTNRGSFVQDNTIIHHNYIHDVHGESMYIGGSKWDSYYDNESPCQGTELYQADLKNTYVYNNVCDSAGWDGIQVGGGIEHTYIYNNVVKNYGRLDVGAHQVGILANPGTVGAIFANTIDTGTGVGIQLIGFDDLVYSNLIVDSDLDGIRTGDRSPLAGKSYRIVNNTIVNSGTYGIYSNSTDAVDHEIFNNLMVACADSFNTAVNVTAENNIVYSSITPSMFEDYLNNDYTPTAGTDMIDSGRLTTDTLMVDLGINPRISGGRIDIGAFERAESSEPVVLLVNFARNTGGQITELMDPSGRYWNNVYGFASGVKATSMIDTNGDATTLGIDFVSTYTGDYNADGRSPNDGIYHNNVWRSAITFDSTKDFNITGLSEGDVVTIEIGGSDAGGTGEKISQITVEGESPFTFNCESNPPVTGTATATVDSSGELNIVCDSNGSIFGVMGLLKITIN